ncbi:MAG: hypothetical protein II866_06455 [Prevotella sp.]|nr:hypothetical protein [Prevotella sp.]
MKNTFRRWCILVFYARKFYTKGTVIGNHGEQVLKNLSGRLTDRFGSGWSVETLKLCRRFFVVYSDSVNSVYPIQDENQV